MPRLKTAFTSNLEVLRGRLSRRHPGAAQQRVLDGKIEALVIAAALRTLGEMRKHYQKALTAVLTGEIAKDLTGHSLADVEKTIAAG